MKQLAPYEMVEIFHQIFDSRKPALPTALSIEEVTNRARFKVEEIIEMLAATSQNQEEFLNTLEKLHQSIDEAQEKVLKKQPTTQDILVNQVDALADLLYFTYGSFVLLGVDPQPVLEIVHQANMGKLFPDGQPHYDSKTGKVLKPENWEEKYAPEAKIYDEILRQKRISQEA